MNKYKILVPVVTVLLALIAVLLLQKKEVQAPAETTPAPASVELGVPTSHTIKKYTPIDPAKSPEKMEIVEKISKVFPEHPEIMVAIALDESGLNAKATGYNCYYKVVEKELGKYDHIIGKYVDFNAVSKTKLAGYRSTYCRDGHEQYAWSRDGGVFQINNPKPEDYDVDTNLARARHKYDTQGLSAWTVYTSKSYEKHLATAKKLLGLL